MANKFFSNWIVKNLILAAVIILALMISANIFLNCTTQHNKVMSVPDFSGLSIPEAELLAANMGLRIDVVDSIYVKRMQRGTIVRQEPKAASLVKKGRRIQLTINAITPRQVPMPNLVGYSLRSAVAELASRGFELGRLIYVNDMATNNVLRQLYQNSEIEAGTMVPCESRIDLVLGLNGEDNVTAIPNLAGCKYRTAIDRIHESSLNVGAVRFDKTVHNYLDSLNARVYSQSPAYEAGTSNMGRTVSIFLTLDEERIPKQTEKKAAPVVVSSPESIDEE